MTRRLTGSGRRPSTKARGAPRSAHLLVACEWGEPLDAELYAGVFGLPGRDERAGT
jgi:hypothetical protein